VNALSGPEEVAWVICVDDMSLKDQWMNEIARVKKA